MAPPNRNTYLEYKRNTARLICWVVTTATSVSRKLELDPEVVGAGPTLPPTPPVSPVAPKRSNNHHGKGKHKKKPQPQSPSVPDDPTSPTSPEITASKLVSLSKLISSSTTPPKTAPSTIYSLFDSVIRARTAAYNFWLEIDSANPSEETQSSNKGHKAFIDALQAAFEALGGLEWQARCKEEREQKLKEAATSKIGPMLKAKELELENRFGGLEINDIPSGGENEELGPEQNEWLKDIVPKQNNGQKKGPSKTRKSAQKSAEAQTRRLENYKIKSDSEALFAAFCFMKDLFDLRRCVISTDTNSYIAGIWQEVADDKLNTAVAGALSNLAAGMVKQLQFDIAADFPQCSNFQAIIDLLIPGNAEYKSLMGKPSADNSHKSQANGNGEDKKDGESEDESTKHIPTFNGLDITEGCLLNAYRDLVTFIIDYRKGRNCRPTPPIAALQWDPSIDLHECTEEERRKWRSNFAIMWLYDMVNQFASTRLTADKQEQPLETVDWKSSKFGRRVLFGPSEFSGEVTQLAMSLKHSPLIEEVQPHMVFQVQVMMDSMTTFKKWHFHLPSPTVPRRTIFGPEVPFELGRHMEDMESFKEDFIPGAELLMDEFKRTDPERWEFPLKNVPPLVSEVGIVLGDSLLSRLTHRAFQSRFLETNRNGLWVYCPWICGVGLAQALNVVFDWGRILWDNSGIALAMFHFYNILLANKYLKAPMPFFEDLLELFSNQVFRGGRRPRNNFFKFWNAASGVKAQYFAPPSTKRLRKGGGIVNNGIENSMWRRHVRTFDELSKLALLGEANWIPNKVDRTKFPALIAQQHLVSGYKGKRHLRETNTSFLSAIKQDLESDLTGPIPFSGLNFLPLLWHFNELFRKVYEGTLDHPTSLAHPLDAHGKWQDTVLYLALFPVLSDDQVGSRLDSDLLKCMGEIFEQEMDGVELNEFVYFDEGRSRLRERSEEGDEPGWRDFEKFIIRGGFFKDEIEKSQRGEE